MRNKKIQNELALFSAIAALLVFAASAFAAAVPLNWPELSKVPRGAANGPNSKDAALIVGIQNYIFVPHIQGANLNAADWRTYLRQGRQIPLRNVGFLSDAEATLENIRDEAKRIAALAKPGGTIWFVFIGHGVASANGEEGLLVGVDAQGTAKSLDARSIPQSEIESILTKSQAARVVMIVDSCFSGQAADGKPLAPGLQALVRTSQMQANNKTIRLTAGKSHQFAGPLPGEHRPAFSYLILGALRGWGDENHDKKVTAEEAVNYANDVLITLAKDRNQTPELIAGDKGAVLAVNVREKGPDIDQMVQARIQAANAAKGNSSDEYIHIPAGSFVLNHPTDAYQKGETVALQAFEMKRTPVTVAEFQKCVEAGACTAANYGDTLDTSKIASCNYNRGHNWLNHPMNCVSWYAAKEYCEWAGGRLPTEEEWEYAATHDGTQHLNTEYPWGNERPDATRGNYGVPKTTPVGKYSPKGDSPLGLVDMIGNVTEWTDSPSGSNRVLKGHSVLVKNASYLSVSWRTNYNPAAVNVVNTGFRCVKESVPETHSANENANTNENKTEKENDFIQIPAGKYVLSHGTQIPPGKFVQSHGTGQLPAGTTVRLMAFEMKKTPVTVAEFQKCYDAGKCRGKYYRQQGNDQCNFSSKHRNNRQNYPMNCVNWNDANEYCRWIGGRLPTEEEWEYAATHNGTGHLITNYPWGNEGAAGRANYDKKEGGTTPVGAYSPAGDSPLGLVDMAGNVWEWVLNRQANSNFYTMKGGSWLSGEGSLNVTAEHGDTPETGGASIGFRCIRMKSTEETGAAHQQDEKDENITEAANDEASLQRGTAPIEIAASIPFIRIPAGSYVTSHKTWDYPVGSTVTLAAFELGKTPVTVAQYRQCVEAGGCSLKHFRPAGNPDACLYNRGAGYQNHPMNCVNWLGAKEYCEWIGARLPTEHEWEYASTHDGKKHLNRKYPWGHFLSKSKANYDRNNIGMPTEVGRYSPKGDSPLGLVDMVGNVEELTSSKAFTHGSATEYVAKGGGWNEYDSFLEVSRSNSHSTKWGYDYLGFRCARSLDAP